MLVDNIFCTKAFAEKNPNTVAAFISASMKGWEYACENPDEAAEIVFNYGSSVSPEHQKYMASEGSNGRNGDAADLGSGKTIY